MTRTKAIQTALAIDGWLTAPEAGLLYDLARSSRGPVVEIGSWRGRSTAALALGSMAGSGQPVYAVDSYEGVPPGDRPTAQGLQPGWRSSVPELLRINLNRAGVSGLVQIVPKPSREAAPEIPDCGVLFVDGGHDYETVSEDLRLYLPKVLPGGAVVIHDVTPGDPGVVRAVDEQLIGNPDWRPRGRYDSAVVFERAEAREHSVYLAFPGRGFPWPVVRGLLEAGLRHKVAVGSGGAAGWDDFNYLWAEALNDFEAGKVTHFVMLHSDVVPQDGWLDVLLAEMDDTGADVLSCVVPIKDSRSLTTTGVGDPTDTWGAYRRLTMHEVLDLPETFGLPEMDALWGTAYAADPHKYLLVNTGCWACDLRNPLFRATGDDGSLRCFFDFPTRVRRGKDGLWGNERESEDWFFSRQAAAAGAKVLATRKVRLGHRGDCEFRNDVARGGFLTDEDTRKRWGKRPAATEGAA